MPRPTPTRANPEAGYMLLAVVVMVALVLIALSVAAPVIARDLRRDKEVESMHRAEQYVRAIRLFYRRNKSYPASIDALKNTNNVRYLRQEYIDPLTGQADWKLIHVGQNQTQVSVFFGEPLSGAAGTGIGGATSGGTAAPAPCGPTNGLAAGFGSSAPCATTGTPQASASPNGDPNQNKNGLNSKDVSSLGSGGAGPIMGVGTARSGESILQPNQQTEYEQWEFLYDPRIELLYQKGRLGGGVGSTNATDLPAPTTSGTPGTPATPGSTTTPGSPPSSTPKQ